MSSVVLTHTGSPVPEYARACIHQIRNSNPKVEIDFIVDYKHMNETRYILGGVDVNIVFSEELSHPTLDEFRRLSWYKAFGKPNTTYPSPENFVQGTSERIFLLNAYLQKTGHQHVWHFENDNLIYEDLTLVTAAVYHAGLQDKLVCCDMGREYCVFNVAFIKEPKYLNDFCEWYTQLMSLGEPVIRQRLNTEMVQEMTVLKGYKNETGNLNFFPSIPGRDKPLQVEDPAGWFGTYDLYFDPASYGQFVAGTNCGHDPGFTDTKNHDIGMEINAGKIVPQFAHFGSYSSPVIAFPNSRKREVALFNLHMHNKTRIKDFVSHGKRL